MKKNLKFLFDHQLPIEHVMRQLVLTNIPMNLSNCIHCLPKVGLHALHILCYLQTCIAPREKGFHQGFQNNSLNEEQTFIFNFVEDILFFRSCRETNYFSQKLPAPPPEYQMVRPLMYQVPIFVVKQTVSELLL